jgi:hypothetical protein
MHTVSWSTAPSDRSVNAKDSRLDVCSKLNLLVPDLLPHTRCRHARRVSALRIGILLDFHLSACMTEAESIFGATTSSSHACSSRRVPRIDALRANPGSALSFALSWASTVSCAYKRGAGDCSVSDFRQACSLRARNSQNRTTERETIVIFRCKNRQLISIL